MLAVNFERINQLKNENFASQKFQQENFKMTEGGTLTMSRNKVLTPRDTNRGLASMANKVAALRDYNQPIKQQAAARGNTSPTTRPRPVYRSEFVIKLQTMREQKRGLRVGGPRRYEFLNEDKIEWMPSVDPIIPEKLPRYERYTATNISNTNISDRSNIGGVNIHAGSNTIGSINQSNHRTGFIKSSGLDTSNTRRTTVLFNNYVDIYEVDDYDRKIEKTWTRLSQLEKLSIRCELNDFKTREMKVHRDSRQNTRLHRI